ncbi:MAG TPA: YihY family inner membrane protein [Usitatibacter sp.]|nr:YihY family inner membrane protein [Usitatibacter sp.]
MRAWLFDLYGFLRFVVKRWTEDRCPQIAGSLTFTTILALVPTFAIGVAALSTSPLFHDVMTKFKIFLLMNLAPEIAGTIITEYIPRFAHNARRLTFVGAAGVLVVAVWLMLIIDRSLNAIWRVRRSRPYWLSALGYALLILAAPLLIFASVSTTTYLLAVSNEVGPASHTARIISLRVVAAVMSSLAFTLVYLVVPHRRVPWRHALLGGFTAGILFEVAKVGFAVYAHSSPTYDRLYGTLAVLPLFLVWLYYSWLVILLGAELTVSASFWHNHLWKKPPRPAMRLAEALAVAQALGESDEPLAFTALQERTKLPAEELEEALRQMSEAHFVKQAKRDAYSLTAAARRPIEQVLDAEVSPTKRRRRRNGRSSR